MEVINPFDFFLEGRADEFSVPYDRRSEAELEPYLATGEPGPPSTRI